MVVVVVVVAVVVIFAAAVVVIVVVSGCGCVVAVVVVVCDELVLSDKSFSGECGDEGDLGERGRGEFSVVFTSNACGKRDCGIGGSCGNDSEFRLGEEGEVLMGSVCLEVTAIPFVCFVPLSNTVGFSS
jgi:hypothetical protein